MATLRNKRKLATIAKENCQEHPRSNLGQNTNVPRSEEDYITQVFEEIEARITKRLSKEFSRTESHILGALSQLDEFFWTRYFRVSPHPLRRCPRTHLAETRDEWGRLPEWSSSWIEDFSESDHTNLWPEVAYNRYLTQADGLFSFIERFLNACKWMIILERIQILKI